MSKVSIRGFRKLGGTWEAHRNGMSSWSYTGDFQGHSYEVRAYAHIDPRFDGDDDSFTVLWHTYRDGKPWGVPTTNPIMMIAEWDQPCPKS